MLSPGEKKAYTQSLPEKFFKAIGAILSCLEPLLSNLRRMLPSPYCADRGEHGDPLCYNGGNINHTGRLVVGTTVVYRTKQETFIPHQGADSDYYQLGAAGRGGQGSMEAGHYAVEDVLRQGVIVEELTVGNQMNVSSGTPFAKHESAFHSIVYTILLLDGTIEDGVPPEAIVGNSFSLVPFETKSESHPVPKPSSCTSASLVQVGKLDIFVTNCSRFAFSRACANFPPMHCRP